MFALRVLRTFDYKPDDMADLSDRVGERTGVRSAVGALQAAQLDPAAGESDAIARNELLAVLAPRQCREGRCTRLAEQVHGVTLLLDQERRRDFTEHRGSCNRDMHTAHGKYIKTVLITNQKCSSSFVFAR